MIAAKRVLIISFFVALTAIGLYGCGGETPTPTPVSPTETPIPPTATPEPPTATAAPREADTPTPQQTTGTGYVSTDAIAITDRAQKTMAGLESYHFTMTTDAGLGINIGYEGDFQKPDKIRMQTNPGTQAATEMVIIGKETYFKQPGIDSFLALGENSETASSIGELAAPEIALSLIDLANSAVMEGNENLNGAHTVRVSFTYGLNKAQEALARQSGTPFTPTPGLGTATGLMWIEKGTDYTRQVRIVTAGRATGQPWAAKESAVTITYSKFNEAVNPPVEKPSNVIELPGGLPTGFGTPTP
jgi:outer membrane lipoprotein-sorting protein